MSIDTLQMLIILVAPFITAVLLVVLRRRVVKYAGYIAGFVQVRHFHSHGFLLQVLNWICI